MLYGYCRSANGNKESIKKQFEWLKNKGVKEKNTYIDNGSALDENRIELNKLFENVKEGDTIFSKDINRITRNNKGLEEIIELAKNKHVKFVLGDKIIDGINGVDKVVEGMSAVFNVFTEYEQRIEE